MTIASQCEAEASVSHGEIGEEPGEEVSLSILLALEVLRVFRKWRIEATKDYLFA